MYKNIAMKNSALCVVIYVSPNVKLGTDSIYNWYININITTYFIYLFWLDIKVLYVWLPWKLILTALYGDEFKVLVKWFKQMYVLSTSKCGNYAFTKLGHTWIKWI